jgi:hypothetical protein
MINEIEPVGSLLSTCSMWQSETAEVELALSDSGLVVILCNHDSAKPTT